MKLSHLPIFATFAAAAALSVSPAGAAVTVLGGGLGNDCYQTAEFGGDAAKGVETCSLALEQETLTVSDRAATFINRGILRSRTGDTDGAIKDYDVGLSIDGIHGEGYVDRGATYIAMQRYQDAMTDINKGIGLGAKKPHIAYYDRAIADEALGDVRGAYLDYKKAVELEPDFALANEQLTRFKVIRKAPTSE
ncbi:MAG TPA: tetratricopeptide repeat protein [Rhizomicrobium sp.]|jgi:tetratricopeptide (TPR) repeat protein